MVSPMRFQGNRLDLIDQRLLPAEEVWVECTGLEDVARAIEDMVVRGAPAIGCTAAFGVALDAQNATEMRDFGAYQARFESGLARLHRTRPTAVNLFYALDQMRAAAGRFAPTTPMSQVAAALTEVAARLFADDLATCQAIGDHGATLARGRRLRVLTHCNAGALATAGYGTAVGVIRSLHAQGHIEMVYADETRPFLQGGRLTAYELAKAGIPYTVIADSVAAYLMQKSQIDLVVVGADRITANGDTANKIGTYGLAVQCHFHGVEFYVAAPFSTFDGERAHGDLIPVEERHGDELRLFAGKQVTPRDAPVYNPSFDVTPAKLISGIITEHGIARAPFQESLRRLSGTR